MKQEKIERKLKCIHDTWFNESHGVKLEFIDRLKFFKASCFDEIIYTYVEMCVIDLNFLNKDYDSAPFLAEIQEKVELMAGIKVMLTDMENATRLFYQLQVAFESENISKQLPSETSWYNQAVEHRDAIVSIAHEK